MRKAILALLLVSSVLLTACGGGPIVDGEALPAGEVETIFVAPELKECEGVGPMQCMQIATSPEGPWELLYQEIEGFSFEPGSSYELRVRKEQVANPPADGSSLRYILEEVVSTTPATDGAGADAELAGSNWKLSDLNGAAPVAGTKVTLGFGADGRASGSAGCNNYGGSYTGGEGTLAVGPLMSTKMACVGEGVMEQESSFLGLLQRAASYTLDGDTLTVTTAEGERLAFARA
jgi:heat shock protein HslJ